MAVAPRPWQTPELPVPSRRPQRQSRTPKIVASPIQSIPRQTVAPQSAIAKSVADAPSSLIKNSPHSSIRVKLFSMGQRFTQILVITGVTAAVGLYASTVHSQKVWGEEFDKLVQLQDHENRFVATSESIKAQVLEQSNQSEVQLVTPSPDQTLYVPAPKTVKLRPQSPPLLKPIENHAPIGY